MAAQQYGVVVDDQLHWARVPLPSEAAQAAVAEARRRKLFQARWIEQDGDDQPDDVDCLLAKAAGIAGDATEKQRRKLAAVVIFSARNAVCLDRDRRLAFGYVRPPPRSVLGGRDGGVDTRLYRRRRHRPDGARYRNKVTGLPRCHADTAAACPAPEPNQFDSGSIVDAGLAKLGDAMRRHSGFRRSAPPAWTCQDCVRRNRQRALDDIMRDQTRGSTVYTALRRLVSLQ